MPGPGPPSRASCCPRCPPPPTTTSLCTGQFSTVHFSTVLLQAPVQPQAGRPRHRDCSHQGPRAGGHSQERSCSGQPGQAQTMAKFPLIFIIYFYPLLPVKYCRQSPRQSTTSRKRIMGIFSCSWPLLQSLNRLGFPTVRKRGLLCRKSDPRVIKTIRARRAAVLPWVRGTEVKVSAANRLIGEVVQSRRRPLLGPSPG